MTEHLAGVIGGGDRTSVSTRGISLIANALCQRIEHLVAPWLQLQVFDSQRIAHIITIAELWHSLTNEEVDTFYITVNWRGHPKKA